MNNISTKKDALARYRMRVAAARAKFDSQVESVMSASKIRKLAELRKKISKT